STIRSSLSSSSAVWSTCSGITKLCVMKVSFQEALVAARLSDNCPRVEIIRITIRRVTGNKPTLRSTRQIVIGALHEAQFFGQRLSARLKFDLSFTVKGLSERGREVERTERHCLTCFN